MNQTIKHDEGKPKLSLVPQRIITEIAHVRVEGLKKYPEDSWREVALSRFLDALMRHVSTMASEGIGSIDEDTGLYHASHAACNLAFIIERLRPRKTGIVPRPNLNSYRIREEKDDQ